MPINSPESFATVGAAVALAINKLVNVLQKRTSRASHRIMNDAENIRAELRAEVKRLTDRIDELYRQLDHWKEKYYSLAEEHLAVKDERASLHRSLEQLRADNH